MDKSNKIERSKIWQQIYNIVEQIPIEEVEGDAIDAPSAATEIEQIFLKYQSKIRSINENKELKKTIDFILSKIYKSEFEVIDNLNQHPGGVNFNEWLRLNDLQTIKEPEEKNELTDFQKFYKDMYPCQKCYKYNHIMVLDNNGICNNCK